MGVIQIALLWSLIALLIVIAIGGFLYIRSRQYISILDDEFERINKFNIGSFNRKIDKVIKRNKIGHLVEDAEKLRKAVNDFNKSTYKQYEKNYEENRKRLSKFWKTPFAKLTNNEIKYIPESRRDNIKWRPFIVNRIVTENFERYTLKTRSTITLMNFRLAELNQTNESKDLIIESIKNLYGEYKQNYKTSIYPQLKTHPILNEKSSIIEKHIKMLEDAIDSKYFRELRAPVNKILREIKDFAVLSIFLEEGYRQINDVISRRWLLIKKMIEMNEEILEDVTKDFDLKFVTIRNSSNRLEKALHNADVKTVKELISKIDEHLFFMENEIEKNVESFALYKTRRKAIIDMVEELNMKRDQLLKEIDKHDLDPNGVKKQLVRESSIQINTNYDDLINEERLTFRYTTPWNLLVKQFDVINAYQNHLESISELVISIKKILAATDDASRIIAELNIEILNSEYRLKLLPKDLQIKKEHKLEKYQKGVNQLVSKYKGRETTPSPEELEKIEAFYKQVTNYWKQINTEAFLSKYVREAILVLNKYQTNNKVKKALPRLKELYNEGQFAIALEEIYPLLNRIKK